MGAPHAPRGYHYFEQKNSVLKCSSRLFARSSSVSLLFELWPQLRERLAWAPLGAFPTRVSDGQPVVRELGASGELWLKRDDESSPRYGGSKLRLLEHLLAEARDAGASCVYSSGVRGSNFALATALHAPRLGLSPGAICFPQPMTREGERSHDALSGLARVVEIPHWSLLPLSAAQVRRAATARGERATVLSQVGFAPTALLGYLAAGLELSRQVERGQCPTPTRVVLPVGSAATSAGLLAGLALAKKLGIWRGALPAVSAVRIAAWPLSRRGRVRSLALSASRALAQHSGEAALKLAPTELGDLELVTDQLGAGYPHATPGGASARLVFECAGFSLLDDTYSAKAAAHVLERLRAGERGPILFWCTKSSAPLPEGPGLGALGRP